MTMSTAGKAARRTMWAAGVLLTLWNVGFASAQSPVAARRKATAAGAQAPLPKVQVRAGDDGGEAGEAALDTATVPLPVDRSAVASPVAAGRRGEWIRPNTTVSVRLSGTVSSGIEKNGDTVQGELLNPVPVGTGGMLPAGTPVKATVVSSAPAGTIASGGVLSLQVIDVGGVPVISDVLGFDGKEGPKEVADAAPKKGTEAMVKAGSVLRFQVLGAGDTPDGGGSGSRAGGGGKSGAGRGVQQAGRGGQPQSQRPTALNHSAKGNRAPATGSTVTTPIHGATQGVTPH